ARARLLRAGDPPADRSGGDQPASPRADRGPFPRAGGRAPRRIRGARAVTVLFISGTGTGVGKTWVTRGLARALVRDGVNAIAIKPIETGCQPEPADAVAIARACGRPELAHAPGLYRARRPLAPWAATLEGEAPASLAAIAEATRALCAGAQIALI